MADLHRPACRRCGSRARSCSSCSARNLHRLPDPARRRRRLLAAGHRPPAGARGAAGELADGARVVVHARPTFWEKRGTLQLAADAIRPVGVGELLARIEHLKRVLAAEGLLDPARRKRPAVPARRRRPGLRPGQRRRARRRGERPPPLARGAVRASAQVAVQGPNAVAEVTAALRELDARPGGRRHRHRPRRRLARGPAAVQQRDAGAGRRGGAHPGRQRDRPRGGQPRCWTSSPTSAPPRRPTPARRSCRTSSEQQSGLMAATARLRHAVTGVVAPRAGRAGRAAHPAGARAAGRAGRRTRGGGPSEPGPRPRAASLARLDRGDDDIRHLRTQVRAPVPRRDVRTRLRRGPATGRRRRPVTAGRRAGDRLRVRVADGDISADVTAGQRP